MKRKFISVMAGMFILANIYGCAILVAGTAAGAGTAVWLSGKMTQTFHVSYEKTIIASKKALSSLGMEIKKTIREADVTQLRSEYVDGREAWVDIRKIGKNSAKVEVRVGAVNPDKEAASKILKEIEKSI